MAFGGPQVAASSSKAMMAAIATIAGVIGVLGAVVVLSIIPTFDQNGSVEGNGEEYNCPAVMLKSVYTNASTIFLNGTVANNPALSVLATMTYKSVTGEKYLTGCILTNLYAWGPYNTSTSSKRRRRDVASGLYTIGQMRCFYNTPCANTADINKFSNASSISGCVKKRLTAANSIFTSSAPSFTPWTPVPNTLTYSIVNSTFTSYVAISVINVYGVPPSTAGSIAPLLTNDTAVISNLRAGCKYAGQISHTAIAAVIANQYSETTTAPSSTQSG